ncbi:MAG: hypothetical protein K2X94_02480 [Amoebophilaceae bacterium]|nr:hypothetical protein [Amoebophilaceae bacterium]
MAFSTKLFRIVITNHYYKTQTRSDFEIQPLPSTKQWLDQRKVVVLNQIDGIELVWLSENYDNPLALFETKAQGITLSFVMTLKNNQVLNVSALEVGHLTGEVYRLHNGQSQQHLLHSGPFMSPSDLVATKQVKSYPTAPGWNVFAMIDIDLSIWLQQLSKANNSSLFTDLNQPYRINIQNRATFWRYYIVDTKKQLNKDIKVVSKLDSAYFGAAELSKDSPDLYCIASTTPIELYDQYDGFFSLCQPADTETTPGIKTLLEKLPFPTYDSLKKDGKNQKKYYNDIVVYV